MPPLRIGPRPVASLGLPRIDCALRGLDPDVFAFSRIYFFIPSKTIAPRLASLYSRHDDKSCLVLVNHFIRRNAFHCSDLRALAFGACLGLRTSESRVRENRTHGLMREGRRESVLYSTQRTDALSTAPCEASQGALGNL